METDRKALRKHLSQAGLSDPLIDAAWPAWWSDDAFSSQSAATELRFSIARKLGLSPKSLLHDEVEFVWKDDARFKHLSNETDVEQSALSSFGISIGRILVHSVKTTSTPYQFGASELRKSILQSRPFVDLHSLLATCWAIGIPVIHLRVFPLDAKRMHAMAVKIAGQHAIMLGRDSQYPAPVAFTLAHEIGHVMLGHFETCSAIVDLRDVMAQGVRDSEEDEADRYALELLLGTSQPEIHTNIPRFNASQLAQAALTQGPGLQVEPGTLALCLAYRHNVWPIAQAAMQQIYVEQKAVWSEVNQIAMRQLDLRAVGEDSANYLLKIMGMGDD